MAAHVQNVFVGLVLYAVFNLSFGSTPHKRFEYKLSFKGPHLVQRDGTIPFWEHGGHAIASDESIRITPSLRSKKGHVWSRMTNKHPNWEIEVSFRISGRGRVGADGLAVWFTAEKGSDGPVFGNVDKWKGLGVFMDSFDNDGQHNNPYVMVMANDGTQTYDHNSDGVHQQLGGCLRDYRNKPYPVHVRVEYYQKALTVWFHNGLSNDPNQYELCMRAENVELPSEGYFGVSGATGGLADDHDVASFLTHSLTPPSDAPIGGAVSEDEKKKFEQEFDDYWKKLQQAKEDYQKEHPDKKPDYGDEDKWFESQDERELKQIFDGQNQIHATVRDLHRKMDEIIGRQERTLSQISYMSQGQGQGQGQAQAQGTGQQGGSAGTGTMQLTGDSIKRHEVDAIMNNQRELVQTSRDLKYLIGEVQNRVNQQGTQGGQGGGYQAQAASDEVKHTLHAIQNDVKSLVGRPQHVAPPQCPPPPPSTCVTPMYLFFFLLLQMAIFIGYSMYRSSKEQAAKKFY